MQLSRMAVSHVISALTKKYSKLLGEFEFAERQVGDAFGLKAIIAATERSDRRKREIEEQLEALETVIWLFDPEWDPALAEPNYPRMPHKKPGEISKAAYCVLREAESPMTSREIAKIVAARLGYRELAERDLARIDSAVYTAFAARVGKTIRIADQHPRRWALIDVGCSPKRPARRMASRYAATAAPND